MRRALGLTLVPGLLAALVTAPADDQNSDLAHDPANSGPDMQLASGHSDSDLGSGTRPFQIASQQTSSSFWVLLSVWHHVETNNLGRGPMGMMDEEELEQWAETYGRDLPSDSEVEEFDDGLFYIGQMLRHGQRDVGSGLRARDLTLGYQALTQGGGAIEGQEDVRDEMQQDWEEAVSQLPIEDIDDHAESVVTTAREWALQGSSTEQCTPAASDDDAGDDSGSESESEVEIPGEYQDYVEAAAEASGFPVGLIAAQIQQESDWNPDAGSPAGALGIVQFMPETWAEFGEGDITDPEASIAAQGEYMRHLREMVESEAGSDEEVVELTLAAYNAGPGAVESAGWEVPPFEETEGYVRDIPAMAGGDINISTGHCAVEVPDMDDVDCGPHEDLDFRNGTAAGSGDNPLTVDVLHSSAEAGYHCGVGAFSTEFDGEISSWHACRPGDPQDHGYGAALDIGLGHMVPSQEGQDYGREIAEWYMENAEELNVSYVIWWEKMWTANEGSKPWDEWRAYEVGEGSIWQPGWGNGSDSQAHRDHPHISFNHGEERENC
ncbi:MAG: lytic transglycosylase domain-containing protein [Nesterenkonia sp.]